MSDLRINEFKNYYKDMSLDKDVSQSKDGGFSGFLENAINSVNNDQIMGEQSISDFVSGRETNLHETLVTLEKADISYKLMMEVRSKLLSAYETVMRTQV